MSVREFGINLAKNRFGVRDVSAHQAADTRVAGFVVEGFGRRPAVAHDAGPQCSGPWCCQGCSLLTPQPRQLPADASQALDFLVRFMPPTRRTIPPSGLSLFNLRIRLST